MRHIFGIVVAIGFLSPTAYAQPTAAVQKSCTIAPEQQSPASLALANGSAAEADCLYAAIPPSSWRTVGIVRAQIQQGRTDEALALTTREAAAHPGGRRPDARAG